MTEFIIGFAVVLIVFWALINRQRRIESRDAVARLGPYVNVFAYNSEIMLVDNINKAEQAASILRKGFITRDEIATIRQLGYEYNAALSVAANLAILTKVIQALKG